MYKYSIKNKEKQNTPMWAELQAEDFQMSYDKVSILDSDYVKNNLCHRLPSFEAIKKIPLNLNYLEARSSIHSWKSPKNKSQIALKHTNEEIWKLLSCHVRVFISIQVLLLTSFFFILFLLLYVYGVCVCGMCLSAHGGLKRTSDARDIDL